MSIPRLAKNESCEAWSRREYFYTGGKYVRNDKGEYFLIGQIFVERLTPATGCKKKYPLIFIHGGYQTGSASRSIGIYLEYPTE